MIGKQARNLTKELVMELRRRIWKFVARQRIEVETKEDMKKRTSESPDMGDSYVIAVEGARREGFLIALLKENVQAEENPEHWLDQEIDNRKKFLAKHELKHV
jgi:hypothetical protein